MHPWLFAVMVDHVRGDGEQIYRVSEKVEAQKTRLLFISCDAEMGISNVWL